MTDYLWSPPEVASLAVKGRRERLPVQRLFFVGRNYAAHAAEMGRTVDKASERPFYFTKSPRTLVPGGAQVPYPPATSNFHHELELVVVLGKPGFQVRPEEAASLIFGYACGLDMTRRDLQLAAREKGHPWDLGKDVEDSSVVGEVLEAPGRVVSAGALRLTVNGKVRQASNVDRLIWSVPELIADLSCFYHLQAGDLLFTGTPEGVGPVVPGDVLEGSVEGVGEVSLRVTAA